MKDVFFFNQKDTGGKSIQNQLCVIDEWKVNYLPQEASSKRDALNCIKTHKDLKEGVEAIRGTLNEGLSFLKFH